MNILKTIFSSATGGLVSSIGEALDRNITSKEERKKLKNELSQIVTDKISEMHKLQADVVKQELSGNWLQRSWRPILMLSFGFIIIYKYFISHVFSLPELDLPVEFWELLKYGIAGYIAGRSGEKIAGVVGKSFGKNKD